MESSIAGMLILGVLIVAVVLMSQAYVASNTILGTAMVESVKLADERSRTELSIASVATDTDEAIIQATNTGSVPIADFDKMDVFVGSERLVYATSTPAAGQWAVDKDSTWKPGETRRIVVGQNVETETVVVSSPRGTPKTVPTPTPTPTPMPTPTPNQVTVSCNNPPTVTTTTTGIIVTCP